MALERRRVSPEPRIGGFRHRGDVAGQKSGERHGKVLDVTAAEPQPVDPVGDLLAPGATVRHDDRCAH